MKNLFKCMFSVFVAFNVRSLAMKKVVRCFGLFCLFFPIIHSHTKCCKAVFNFVDFCLKKKKK